MRDPYEGMEDPTKRGGSDAWISQIINNPFWYGGSDAPGSMNYTNPVSSGFFGEGQGAGIPLKFTKTPPPATANAASTTANAASTAPTYWNPAGFAAGTPGTTYGLEAAAMPNFLAGMGGAGAAAMTGRDWLDTLGGLGELFGNTASQRAGERNLESLANAANYRTQQDALLRAIQLAMLSQQQLPGQMTRANLMANPPADLKLSHPRATMPTMSGGIQMGNLTSGASQALGEAMKKSALERGLKGYDTSGMVLPPPEYLRGNWLDTLLNAGGFAGGVANAWTHGTGKT